MSPRSAASSELLAEVELDVASLIPERLTAERLSATEPEAVEAAASTMLALHLLELFGVLPLDAPCVVGGALVGVAEHVVGGIDLFEPSFGVAVAAGHVRVVLAGQLAISGADVALGGVSADAENLIEVLRHRRDSVSAADCIISAGW